MVHKTKMQIALIGPPNVGKSALFTRLTGVGVISSNYPGTTVEFEEATLLRNGIEMHFHDLPGSYTLSAISEDEKVVVDMLIDNKNDVIVVVGDATDLPGSIMLCYEVIELGIPVVLALNRIDVASKRYTIDADGLSKGLGIPVVPISAKTGKGIEDLLNVLTSGDVRPGEVNLGYDDTIQGYIEELMGFMDDGYFNKRGRAIKSLEGVTEILDKESDYIREAVMEMSNEFLSLNDEHLTVRMSSDRFIHASRLINANVVRHTVERGLSEKISDYTIEPSTGFPILVAVMFSVLAVIVYAGEYLDIFANWLYDTLLGTALPDLGGRIGGDMMVAVFTGIDGALRAILCLVVPYIMVFYIMLGLLEDSGYLPRVVVLLDKALHRIGLHGGGFIPMVVGIGCNVPAILATRTLSSKRERRILCTLIVMCIPCSAQMAIIVGTTGVHAGVLFSSLILLTLLLVGTIVGIIMNKTLPVEPSNLMMELPELTVPSMRNILFKMWARTKDFFSIAVPILIIGSVVVEIMLMYEMLDPFVEPLSFITVTLLGLPAVTIIGFIVGVLRKEMAYGMLLVLAGSVPIEVFMSPHQFIVFGIVMATYMPCLATMAVLGREMGMKDTAIITVVSISMAILLGTLFNYGLTFFGV